jgi:hypothetical protein
MSTMTGPDGNVFVAWISRVLFGLAGAALIAFAVALVVYGIVGVLKPAQRLDFAMLDAIGYVVISIAVFDVAKYLIEEEVMREREMRRAGETRQSLTRFVATIIIATLLEAIVIVFKTARDQVPQLIYPVLLVFAGVALMVGLGVFQRLSARVEREADEQARDEPARG